MDLNGNGHLVGFPYWFNSTCDLSSVTADREKVELSGNGGRVVIRANYQEVGLWAVEWWLQQPRNRSYRGCKDFTTSQLLSAFCLNPHAGVGVNCEYFLRFGGMDAGEDGVFCRWRCFLNIPCPGSGRPHDPNCSILLNHGIISAVARYVGYVPVCS